MKNIMTAKEARDLMSYKDIYIPLITKAALEGKDHITVHERLNSEFFTLLGYKVEQSCHRNINDPNIITKISW